MEEAKKLISMEAYMKSMKRIIVIMIICVTMGTVFAATPSVFDVGILNYYKIQNLVDQDFASYTPGVRLETHITPWFGLGADVLLEAPFAAGAPAGTYNFIGTTDVSFRASLGFFEPFLAVGPAYQVTVDSTSVTLTTDVSYSARAGFDFNITDILTVGAEGKLIVNDLPGLIDGSVTSVDWLDATYVGLSIKAKF